MIKKLGVGLIAIALAFFAFIYVQKGKAEERLRVEFQRNNVQAQSSTVELLPSPALVLNDVRYAVGDNEFRAARVILRLETWALLSGDVKLAALLLDDGRWQPKTREKFTAFSGIHGSVTPSQSLDLNEFRRLAAQFRGEQTVESDAPVLQVQLSGHNADGDQINLNSALRPLPDGLGFSDTQLNIVLNNKRLLNTNTLDLRWQQGELNWRDAPRRYVLEGARVEFNRLPLGAMLTRISLEPQLRVESELKFFNGETVNIEYGLFQEPAVNGKWRNLPSLHLHAQDQPLTPWLNAFKLPLLVSGRASLKLRVIFDGMTPVYGDLVGDAVDGAFSGFDALGLMSQYLPINYDETRLHRQDMSTFFHHMFTSLYWMDDELVVEGAMVEHKDFTMQSQGSMDLTRNDCDFNARINATDPRYRELSLPIHFFGRCDAPQYKLKIDRNLRNQLKNILKEKLK